jgi:hypothetical protein
VPKLFSFGFTHWRQAKNFGLSSAKKNWFISLLQRMKEMGKESIQDVFSGKKGIRAHKISWDKAGTTMKQKSFCTKDWLGEEFFKENELYQFHISKGEGRVIGFVDANIVFQIVLLDRDHNAQPSKFNNYKVVKNAEDDSEYNILLKECCKIVAACYGKNCENNKKFDRLRECSLPKIDDKASILINISECMLKKIYKVCGEKKLSVEDVFELGLDSIKDITPKESNE